MTDANDLMGRAFGGSVADGEGTPRAEEAQVSELVDADTSRSDATASDAACADDARAVDLPALPAAVSDAGSPGPRDLHDPRKARWSTYVVVGCAVALLVLTMLGGLLNVGDHLAAAHPALAGVFYMLLAVLVAVGVALPLLSVSRRPIFSLYQLRDERGYARERYCRMLVDNLKANTELSAEEVAQLDGYLARGDEADDLLIAFFEERITPQLDAETKRAATTAFFVSALSRSPLVSTVTMLSLCLDLVRAIVERCGFRPTNAGLARLYARVMLSALVVGGIEDSDLSDLLGQLLGGGAGGRAGGLLLGTAAEGMVSAFLVFRVGVICKRWLTAADGPARMEALRRTSYREALSLMRTSGFMSQVAETAKAAGVTVAGGVASGVADAARSAAQAGSSAARDAAHAAADAVRDTARSVRDRFK